MAAIAHTPPLYQPNYHQQHQHHSTEGNVLPPYGKLSIAKPPPPYFLAGVDIASLPPLPETPSESEELAVNQQYQNQELVYWDGQEVFRYYSPDGGEPVLYFSGDEGEYDRRPSPQQSQQLQQYHHHHPQEASRNPRSGMGSGSSSMNDDVASRGQRPRKNRRNSSGSDNGGFETAPPKTSLGVKEKLRSSLDKISLKPFRWSSSDKLTHGSTGSSSKSKSKSNRRYSDSGAAFAVNSPSTSETSNNSCSHRSGSASCEAEPIGQSRDINPRPKDKKAFWKNAPNRLIRPNYLTEPGCRGSQNAETTQPKQPTEAVHNYVNLASVNVKTNQYARRARQDRVSNEYHQITPQANSYYDLGTSKVKDTAARAKGTWNMLKTANTRPVPLKASTAAHSSYASLVSGSSETLQSSGTAHCQNMPETWSADVTEYDASVTLLDVGEESNEPPKLAPVSGKLLLDKGSESSIVRPTAFKPVARKAKTGDSISPPATAHNGSWENVASNGSSPRACELTAETSAQLDTKRSVSADSNHSDSGRHSSNSIPAAGNCTGGSFSCSGSEGYESARVSSSTTHSAMHESDQNALDPSLPYSPKNLSDDVMIRDLECRVKAKEGELQLLRRSFEDNEKALHMVYEDRQLTREVEIQELKQRYALQLRSQTAKVLKQQRKLERENQLSKEENKQLLRTNIELEDRIRSMSDAIENQQSRQQGRIAELKARLEENESQMQQKHGVISHLKRQLKERQNELTQRTGEIMTLRSRNRELAYQVKQRDQEVAELSSRLQERNRDVDKLERSLEAAESSLASLGSGQQPTAPPCNNNNNQTRDDKNYLAPLDRDSKSGDGGLCSTQIDSEELLLRLRESEELRSAQARQFEMEKQQWAQEKNRVIRYQKQLQVNYVQMFKRNQALEEELDILSSQLGGGHGSDLSSPVSRDSVHSSNHLPLDMCYPMEI